MRKLAFLTALVCLFSLSVFAQQPQPQSKTSFAGNWELDAKKSKLPEMLRVESITLKVGQTEKELTIESATKRIQSPEGMDRRGGGRGLFGDGTTTYSLDGKETTVERESPMGKIPVTLLAKTDAPGKLKLSTTRKFNSPMGERVMTTQETWELLDGGKTLKIVREMELPNGPQTMEMYFTKK